MRVRPAISPQRANTSSCVVHPHLHRLSNSLAPTKATSPTRTVTPEVNSVVIALLEKSLTREPDVITNVRTERGSRAKATSWLGFASQLEPEGVGSLLNATSSFVRLSHTRVSGGVLGVFLAFGGFCLGMFGGRL